MERQEVVGLSETDQSSGDDGGVGSILCTMATVPSAPLAALFAPLAHRDRELCATAYFDAHGLLLGLRHCGAGERTMIRLPIREIAIDMLAYRATSIVLAHNHPSGDHRPSEEDLSVTRRLVVAFGVVGANFYDHLILSANGVFSFRSAGLL